MLVTWIHTWPNNPMGLFSLNPIHEQLQNRVINLHCWQWREKIHQSWQQLVAATKSCWSVGLKDVLHWQDLSNWLVSENCILEHINQRSRGLEKYIYNLRENSRWNPQMCSPRIDVYIVLVAGGLEKQGREGWTCPGILPWCAPQLHHSFIFNKVTMEKGYH